MKLGSVAVPTAAAIVILLLGLGVGLVVAGAVMASEPAEEDPAKATPTATPSPPRPQLPDPPAKLQLVEGSTITALPLAQAQNDGATYTWRDGDATLKVVAQTDLVAQDIRDNTADDEIVGRDASGSIVRRQAENGGDARPVFRPESGGGLMTLPGGVLLALDPAWDEGAVERFFSRNDILPDERSALGSIQNGFLVTTEPGFPSLELANALASQEGVMISSPNWWTELEAK
ncbi:MAG: hypothetical protein OXE50_02755 [Chloroflexi bacterium]|nr:hypothetical protein [Chloroflexota bacterium]